MGWSLDSWGGANERLAQASQFLSTGIVGTAFGGTGCTSSTQCASGYKCSGGRCVQITTSGGSGGSGGVGNNTGGSYVPCDGGPDGTSPSGGPGSGGCSSPAPIGGGGGGGCTTSTCGQGSNGYGQDSDCCGDRCCRYFATGISSQPINVNCYCGNCPGTNGSRCGDGYPPCGPGLACINGYCTEVKPCNKFCSEYYEANGEDAAGCSQDYRCDECTECTGEFGNGGGNYCDSKANLPCHCNGADLAECDICNSDGSVSPGVCLECCTIQNYDCGCGVAVTAQVCRDRDASGLSQCNLAQDAAAQKCAEECGGGPDRPDPCAGVCEGQTRQGTGACPDPNGPIDCPDGSNCNWTGCIESGGEHFLLYDQCDLSNVPEECKACDCNCHSDCPPCQLCGADGTCYVDPSCAEEPSSVKITTIRRQFNEEYLCVGPNCPGSVVGRWEDAPYTTTVTVNYTDFKAKTIINPPTRVCDDYVEYRAGGTAWYASGRRAIGGPIVNGDCPGGGYDCPACNGNRISTWHEYEASYEFID